MARAFNVIFFTFETFFFFFGVFILYVYFFHVVDIRNVFVYYTLTFILEYLLPDFAKNTSKLEKRKKIRLTGSSYVENVFVAREKQNMKDKFILF